MVEIKDHLLVNILNLVNVYYDYVYTNVENVANEINVQRI